MEEEKAQPLSNPQQQQPQVRVDQTAALPQRVGGAAPRSHQNVYQRKPSIKTQSEVEATDAKIKADQAPATTHPQTESEPSRQPVQPSATQVPAEERTTEPSSRPSRASCNTGSATLPRSTGGRAVPPNTGGRGGSFHVRGPFQSPMPASRRPPLSYERANAGAAAPPAVFSFGSLSGSPAPISQPLLPSPVQASYEPASSNNSVPGSQQSALLSSPPPAAGERMQSGDRRHNQQAHVEGRPSPHSGKRPQPSGQSKGPRADRGRTSTGGVPQQA